MKVYTKREVEFLQRAYDLRIEEWELKDNRLRYWIWAKVAERLKTLQKEPSGQ